MSAPPDRKFDISWIQETLGGSSAPAPDSLDKAGLSVPTARRGTTAEAVPFHREILKVVANLGGRCHVVDIAEKVDLGFDDALRAVLQLAGRQELRILERDRVANDHLVELTEKGEQLLHS